MYASEWTRQVWGHHTSSNMKWILWRAKDVRIEHTHVNRVRDVALSGHGWGPLLGRFTLSEQAARSVPGYQPLLPDLYKDHDCLVLLTTNKP